MQALSKLLELIKAYQTVGQPKRSFDIWSIAIKGLYQAKPQILTKVARSDLTALITQLDTFKNHCQNRNQCRQIFERLLEIIKRYEAANTQLTPSEHADLKVLQINVMDQFASVLVADDKFPEKSETPLAKRLEPDELLAGIKYRIIALRMAEKLNDQTLIVRAKQNLSNQQLQSWQAIIRAIYDSRLRRQLGPKPLERKESKPAFIPSVAALSKHVEEAQRIRSEEIQFEVARNNGSWQKAFNLGKEKIAGWNKENLYEPSFIVLNYEVGENNRASDFNLEELFSVTADVAAKELMHLKDKPKMRLQASTYRLLTPAATTEEINHPINLTLKDIPDWQESRKVLAQMRSEAKRLLEKGLDIRMIQQEMARVYRKLTRDTLAHIEKVLHEQLSFVRDNRKNWKFCLLAAGSQARGDVHTKSDMEPVGVVDNLNEEDLLYFLSADISIWRVETEMLGESIEGSSADQCIGFHLDSPIRVTLERDKFVTNWITTLETYPKHVMKMQNDKSLEDIARLRPVFLAGDIKFFVITEKCKTVQRVTPEPKPKEIQTLLEPLLNAFPSVNGQAPSKVNIKKDYLQPMTVIFTLLSHLYGFPFESSGHPLDLILILSEYERLDKKFLAECKDAIGWLSRTQLQRQLAGLNDEIPWGTELAQIDQKVVKPLCLYIKGLIKFIENRETTKALVSGPTFYPFSTRSYDFKPIGDFLTDKFYQTGLDKKHARIENTNDKAFDEELYNFNLAAAFDQNNSRPFDQRAREKQLLKQYEEVVIDMNQVIDLLTVAFYYREKGEKQRLVNLAGAYHGRGLAYERLKRFHEALADFETVIQMKHIIEEDDETWCHYYSSRGLTYKNLGMIDEARKDLAIVCEYKTKIKSKNVGITENATSTQVPRVITQPLASNAIPNTASVSHAIFSTMHGKSTPSSNQPIFSKAKSAPASSERVSPSSSPETQKF